MVQQVKLYVGGCTTCNITKTPNQTLRPLVVSTPLPDKMFQKLFVDFTGPYSRSKSGNVGAIVVLDQFMKFVFVEPVWCFVAEIVTRFLVDCIFNIFGTLELMLTDNSGTIPFRSFRSGDEAKGN